MKKITIISLYPFGMSPGPRFRFEQYLPLLKEKYEVQYLSFFSEEAYKILYKKGHLFGKVFSVLRGTLLRVIQFPLVVKADFVFIYREAFPYGPPWYEWIIAKILKKKIIYDFDDAIWQTDHEKGRWLTIWLRNASKVNKIMKWSWKVSCGNEYLCNHARLYNQQVILNPTTIDTVKLHNKVKDQFSNRFVLGWTGSHSTLKYLEPIIPIIQKLEELYDFDFLVICNIPPSWHLRSLKFLTWQKESEIEDLMQINVGIMPLPDDEWSKGKCGFKALQYMALGMPALVSPVGVNVKIVQHGVNGYLCSSSEDWFDHIVTLMNNDSRRREMGDNARRKVLEEYSVLSNSNNFIRLFT